MNANCSADEPHDNAGSGTAEPGKPMTPGRVPATSTSDAPRPAPAPGVPVSVEEYERLKERAKDAPAPDDVPGQEE